jgi:hypothetical protein
MNNRQPYPSSPNARIPLYALGNDVDVDRLNFSRVLFLDIDGVLHPDSCDPERQFCFVHNFCETLKLAAPHRDVPIVISSTWRMDFTIDAMRAHFPVAMNHQIVGVTPDLDVIWESSEDRNRQSEIEAWMQDESPDGDWLAIDDRSSFFRVGCPKLFLVPQNPPGRGAGIDNEVNETFKRRLIEFLSGRESKKSSGVRSENR